MERTSYHIPVLLEPAVDLLGIDPAGTYADLTFGGGGHSRRILEKLGERGRLYAFDQDSDTLANVPDDPRFRYVASNFRFLRGALRWRSVEAVDGILADLGVSSHHFDATERGFSFRGEAPLDMRMNRRARRSAAAIIAEASEERLADIFYLYGELKQSRQIARAIVRARESGTPVETIGQLIAIVTPMLDSRREKKELACVFQALRIEVNDEMGALRDLLQGALQVLKPGGRLAVITYHSLEDRLVKNFMKTGNFEGKVEKDFYGRLLAPMKPVSNRPIVPDEAEIAANPRSRSAKLRVSEKITEKR